MAQAPGNPSSSFRQKHTGTGAIRADIVHTPHLMNLRWMLLPAATFAVCEAVRQLPPGDFTQARETMFREQIAARGVRDARVLEAPSSVPRHEFVPESGRDMAYADRPLPLGHGQTISQPCIVAFMTAQLAPTATDRVL